MGFAYFGEVFRGLRYDNLRAAVKKILRRNWYSTPLTPATRCDARLLPGHVEIWHKRQCVARYERNLGGYQRVRKLEREPKASAGLRPLQQWPGARSPAGKLRRAMAQSRATITADSKPSTPAAPDLYG